jgi:hypothetical protein
MRASVPQSTRLRPRARSQIQLRCIGAAHDLSEVQGEVDVQGHVRQEYPSTRLKTSTVTAAEG